MSSHDDSDETQSAIDADDASAYTGLIGAVDSIYSDQRAAIATAHATRNQLLAFFLLACLLLLALAAMQASTYCDPLVLFSWPRAKNSRS